MQYAHARRGAVARWVYWARWATKACAGFLLLTAAAFAFAHASLLATQPADGALLATAPAEVQLRFNEPVAPLVFKLVAPDGSVTAINKLTTTPDGLWASLPPQAGNGTYLFSWRVVSADGHPVGGALAYSIGARSAAAAGVPTTASPTLRAGIWLTRLGLYLALFVGTGAVLCRAFLSPPAAPPARWSMLLSLAGMVMLPLSVGMLGLDALAAPWAALLTAQPWQASLATSYGNTAYLMLASLMAAAFASVARGRAAKPAAIAACLLLAAALGASGHASAAPPQWLARPAVFIHALAITAWIGSLLPLLLALRGNQGPVFLQRFSRAIPWVLGLLLASGATLAALQLDGLPSLWRTDYGRILSAKLVLVLLLLSVAACNRYRLSDAVRNGDAAARRWMRRLIALELLLALGVFALAATWRFTPPPRALAAVPPRITSIHLHGPRAMADLTLTPENKTRLRADLVVSAGDAAAQEAKEVALEFSNPGLGTEALRRDALRQPDGTWRVEPITLPAPGRWHVRIDVLVSDFEQARLEGDVEVGP